MGQPRKKKKRRKKRYLLKFTILVAAAVGAYFFLTSTIFDIQQIIVENNTYYTSEQVIDFSGAKTGQNLFQVKTSKLRDQLLKNPYIKSVKVKRKIPDKLVISVVERKEFAAVAIENVQLQVDVPQEPAAVDTGSAVTGSGGAVTEPAGVASGAAAGTGGIIDPAGVQGQAADGAGSPAVEPQVPIQTSVLGTLYAILDKDGLVLRTTPAEPALTVIYGLSVESAKEGKAIVVGENLMFTDTMDMIQSMNENELFFKRIRVAPVVIRAYIYDALVCEGTPENIKKDMASLKAVLYQEFYDKGVERGVIHANGDGKFTFSPIIE